MHTTQDGGSLRVVCFEQSKAWGEWVIVPTCEWTLCLLCFRRKQLMCCFTSVVTMSFIRHLHSVFLDLLMEVQDQAAHNRARGMMRLTAWTPTDLPQWPCTTAPVPSPRRTPLTLKTASVPSKNQMRKFPSFMSRREKKKKKTLFAQKGYVKRLNYLFILYRW